MFQVSKMNTGICRTGVHQRISVEEEMSYQALGKCHAWTHSTGGFSLCLQQAALVASYRCSKIPFLKIPGTLVPINQEMLTQDGNRYQYQVPGTLHSIA